MIAYIIKSTICLVLLLAFYHFVLEKEKMHRFNRFYLLGAIVFSFIVPSFIITVAPAEFVEPILHQQENVLQFQSELTTTEIVQEVDYTNYFIGLYCIISLVLLFLLTKKIYQLLEQTKRNKKVSYYSATVVLLREKIIPYTFLHYIFINKKKYKTNAVEQQILTHELTHVQQKHSLDVLFIEILQNLFWFNPIFRYYKKAIQLNHEFLADDAVLKSHKNIAEYQYVLLNTTAQQNNIYLASNLNYSLTKKRLLMMTTPSSRTNILLKKLMVFPLIAGFIFAFAQRVEAQEKLPQAVEANINYNNDIEAVKVEESRTSYNGIMYAYTIKNNGNKKISSKDYTIVFKVDDRLVQFNEELPDLYPGETFKNGSGYTFYSNLKRNDKTRDFDEIKPRASINYSLEIKYIDANIENNAINGISIFDKKNPQIIKKQEGISEKEMKEYKTLLGKESKSKIYKVKDVNKMISLYKKMSKKQQQSVTDIRKVIPPPPMDIVFTYKKLAKRIQSTSKNRKANVIYLNELYNKMTASQKKQVTKPSRVLPPPPPLKKNATKKEIERYNKAYKIWKEKVNKLPPPPPPKKKENEMAVAPVINENHASSNQWVEVVELLQSAPGKIDGKAIPPPPLLKKNATKKETERYNKAFTYWKKKTQNPIKVEKATRIKTILNYIKNLHKRGAKFTYNGKKITFKKATKLVKEENIHNLYSVENKDKTIEVNLSDTPFVNEKIE